jgi:hypothetical protein
MSDLSKTVFIAEFRTCTLHKIMIKIQAVALKTFSDAVYSLLNKMQWVSNKTLLVCTTTVRDGPAVVTVRLAFRVRGNKIPTVPQ